MILNQALRNILDPAYLPCIYFSGKCSQMIWNPRSGHVPRGFAGGAGSISEIELILVFAEPGDPHDSESHTDIESAYHYACDCFKFGKDQFHRNVRAILDLCWPNMPFDEQMKKVWLTESVLCSASVECGSIPKQATLTCGSNFLLPQLQLLPEALIVGLGSKAQSRLSAIGVTDFLPAFAVAPPGCNRKEAQSSWNKIPIALKQKFGEK